MVDGTYAQSKSVIGHVDSVGEIGPEFADQDSLGRGSFALISGWAIFADTSLPVSELHVRLDAEPSVDVTMGLSRPDVAVQHGSGARDCGFVVALPVTAPVGEHRLVFEAVRDGVAIPVEMECNVTVLDARDPLRDMKRRDSGWASSIDGVQRDDTSLVVPRESGVVVLPWGERASIKLWAIDVANGVAPVRVVARFGGVFLRVFGGVPRADAAAEVGIPDADHCGFLVPVSAPLTGETPVELFAIGLDGTFGVLGSVTIQSASPLPLEALPQTALLRGQLDDVSVGGVSLPSDAPVALPADGVLFLRGWLIDAVGPMLCSSVYVRTDDGQIFDADYSEERPDVVADIGATAVAACGFKLAISASKLCAGRSRLSVTGLTGRGDASGSPWPPLVVDVEGTKAP